MKHKKNQQGQVLLIVAMVLATVVAVVLAVTFRSQTETQTTKLDQESQRALAAAEAGIEQALATKTNYNINTGGFTGAATIQPQSGSPSFVTAPLQKDEEYTFYLRTYDPIAGTFSGAAYNKNITVYFGDNSNCPTLEFSIINASGGVIRHLARPACENNIQGSDLSVTTASSTQLGYTFSYNATLPQADLSQGDVLMIRLLSSSAINSAHLAFTAASGNLPLQGNVVTSEAKSTSLGVSKKVQLFQSYPQIPSEFFVSSF